jgi:cell shape-determining protein MreC
LSENVDYASDELVQQDQTISQLRNEISKLKQTNQSLEKDLNLANKLAQMRKTPLPSSETYPYLKYALYTLLAV